MDKVEEMLAKKGVCIKCGLARAEEGRYLCSWCKKEEEKKPKKSRYVKSVWNEKKEQKTPKQRKKYTLDEVCKMARERGISYGQMVILLEREKK